MYDWIYSFQVESIVVGDSGWSGHSMCPLSILIWQTFISLKSHSGQCWLKAVLFFCLWQPSLLNVVLLPPTSPTRVIFSWHFFVVVDWRAGNPRPSVTLSSTWQPRGADSGGKVFQRSYSSPNLEQTLMLNSPATYMPSKWEGPLQFDSSVCDKMHLWLILPVVGRAWSKPVCALLRVWFLLLLNILFCFVLLYVWKRVCVFFIIECGPTEKFWAWDYLCMSLFFSLYILVGLGKPEIWKVTHFSEYMLFMWS